MAAESWVCRARRDAVKLRSAGQTLGTLKNEVVVSFTNKIIALHIVEDALFGTPAGPRQDGKMYARVLNRTKLNSRNRDHDYQIRPQNGLTTV
jgi:hypothetical protein